ncbi:AAA family ATPase [Deinococcus yavapaiensis]|uniref:AAA domain-containing protein n=1 Tax=Deinococcus yavapaiensis KR-236 TaxID=694435 RepID=A0A318S9E3_9DEIO|nr:AAA family ATPase [Deinococcus yavapaiensis]PYE55760.1 AAA domain-containing protein [Deinococcus yavapaiensis KR-236]
MSQPLEFQAAPDEGYRLVTALRRFALPILGATLLAGAGGYLLAKRNAPVYQASSTIMIASGDGNGVLRDTVVTSSPPSASAVMQALRSQPVGEDIIRRLPDSGLSDDRVQFLQNSLRNRIRNGNSPLTAEAANSGDQGNVIIVRAYASTPLNAQALANTGVAALLAWDAGRAGRRLEQVRASIERQLEALNRADLRDNLVPTEEGALNSDARADARSRLVRDLALIDTLRTSTVTSLDVVAPATVPSTPISPQPGRNALLAALLALLAASGAAVLIDALRRRVDSERDAARWGLPVLGQLSRLDPQQLQEGVLRAAHEGGWAQSLGFTRVNLLAQLAPHASRRVVFSSLRGGEGASSVTAAVATALAAGGQRVLVVDADPQGHRQLDVWGGSNRGVWRDVAIGRAEDNGQVAVTPQSEETRVLAVTTRVDLLLANASDGSRIADVRAVLASLSQAYDVVLIDAPPVLQSADALELAPLTEGLVLVVEAASTTDQDVERALRHVKLVGGRVLGIMLNKVSTSSDISVKIPSLKQRSALKSAKSMTP